jgi:hypothetical protein
MEPSWCTLKILFLNPLQVPEMNVYNMVYSLMNILQMQKNSTGSCALFLYTWKMDILRVACGSVYSDRIHVQTVFCHPVIWCIAVLLLAILWCFISTQVYWNPPIVISRISIKSCSVLPSGMWCHIVQWFTNISEERWTSTRLHSVVFFIVTTVRILRLIYMKPACSRHCLYPTSLHGSLTFSCFEGYNEATEV